MRRRENLPLLCCERGSAQARRRMRRKMGQRGKRTPGLGGAACPCPGKSLLIGSERKGRADHPES